MKSTRHLVFITPGFARDEADFLCTPYLQDYFVALQAARPDWRITIIALQYPYFRGTYEWRGIKVHALGGKNRRLLKPWIWWRCGALLRRLHREQPIDLVHAYWLGEGAACGLKFARRARVPMFATVMGQDALPENRYLKRLDFGGMKTIALSEFSAGLFAQNARQAADVVIPFGLNEADIDRSGNAGRPIDILGVSSLIKAKRLDRFVRVVNMLREQFPNLRAVLVGEGPELAALTATIAELGLQAHLRLMPIVSRQEILALMSQSKVFLHTSRIEGMGLVFAEALGRGCHLVSTPVGVAAPSEKCLLSVHTFGLVGCAAQFLQFPVDYLPRVPHPIAATIDAHLNIYGLDR